MQFGAPGSFALGRRSIGFLAAAAAPALAIPTDFDEVDELESVGMTNKARNSVIEDLVERDNGLYEEGHLMARHHKGVKTAAVRPKKGNNTATGRPRPKNGGAKGKPPRGL